MHKEQYGVYLLMRGDTPDLSFSSYKKTLAGVIADVPLHLLSERLERKDVFEGEMTTSMKDADLYLNMDWVVKEMAECEIKTVQLVPEVMTKYIDTCIAWMEDKNGRHERTYQLINHDLAVWDAQLTFETGRCLDRRFYPEQSLEDYKELDRQLTVCYLKITSYQYCAKNNLTGDQCRQLFEDVAKKLAEKRE